MMFCQILSIVPFSASLLKVTSWVPLKITMFHHFRLIIPQDPFFFWGIRSIQIFSTIPKIPSKNHPIPPGAFFNGKMCPQPPGALWISMLPSLDLWVMMFWIRIPMHLELRSWGE